MIPKIKPMVPMDIPITPNASIELAPPNFVYNSPQVSLVLEPSSISQMYNAIPCCPNVDYTGSSPETNNNDMRTLP